MPKLSLYRPYKSNDYKFLDRNISEMFQVGCTDLYFHKYLGPKNPTPDNATVDQPIYDVLSETNIQDLLFLENRDRKYDQDIFTMRGHFQVQDLDFNLSQFGLFIDNDTIYMTIHINDTINSIGRKPISGDVIEIPALSDEFALNNYDSSLPRFFVITDVGRAAEGFTPTWFPHLYRLKLNKISDEAQYSDILVKPTDDTVPFMGDFDPDVTYNPGDVVRYQGQLYTVTTQSMGHLPTDTNYYTSYTGETYKQIMSSAAKSAEINDAVIAQAEEDTPMSGYETQQFFTLAVSNNDAELWAADLTTLDASYTGLDASSILDKPIRSGYCGYLLGDGIPENGAMFGHGISFPLTPSKDDFFLRTDFLPNRLFRFNGNRWVKHEDSVRHQLTNTGARQTLKTSFINNRKVDNIDGSMIPERQALSTALRPRADF